MSVDYKQIIASITANNPPLHFVAGNIDSTRCRLGRVGCGKPLQRRQQHDAHQRISRLAQAARHDHDAGEYRRAVCGDIGRLRARAVRSNLRRR